MSMGMQIGDQSTEIHRLDRKFKQALFDKISLYEELAESVKELAIRNSRFVLNDLEAGRMVNEGSIMKRELE